MVDLKARTPMEGLLPVRVGTVSLSEAEAGVMTSVAAYRGRSEALGQALKAAHGLAMPAPNRCSEHEGARAIWFGREMILLTGPAPDPRLAKHAALVDQSDAWAVARLDGPGAADVLARLCPVDLRIAVFGVGCTARTEVGHMMASVTRIGEDGFEVMVFRAFGRTLVHELCMAMEAVAARAAG